MKTPPPTLYLFAGSNGAGKTTFARAYGPLADTWQVWDNRNEPPSLILSSESATLSQLEHLL